MNKDKLWERFVFLMSVDSFGEKEVIMEAKRQKMFLGSIEKHKKIFNQAWDDMIKMYEEQRKIPAWMQEELAAEDDFNDVDVDRLFGDSVISDDLDLGGEG